MRHKIFGLSALLAACLFGYAAQAADISDRPVIAATPTLPAAGDKVAYGEAPAVPASGFFPILPFDADSQATPQLLPVASNHPLDGTHENITRAVVIIHDVTRDANGAVAMLTALAGPRNGTTLIVAPQFMLASDIARFKGHLPEGGRNLAHWPLNAWEGGGESVAASPAQKGVSSFTAMDLLLLYLGDKTIFPALKEIVIAGHGAGGDFALRYAALGQAPDLLDPQKTSVRFVAANASSYLYFTSLRPLAGKPGFGMPDAKACPGYHDYGYGLNHLNAYAQRSGGDDIRLRYPSRRVIVLAGAGAEDPFPDTNCAALLEGPNRLARAASYDIYIHTIFSDAAANTQSFSALPDAGYDPVAIFDSSCGISALFGNGRCAVPVRN